MPSTSQRRRKSAPPLVGARAAGGSAPTRSPGAARPAARGRRCARSRRPSCRSRSPASCGSTSASVSPATWTRRTDAGMRACSSAVSFGSRRSGSSDGSPTGSEPSGSSCAARWPCVRCALTSAIAAATPPSSSGSGAAGDRLVERRGGRSGGRRRGGAAAGAAVGDGAAGGRCRSRRGRRCRRRARQASRSPAACENRGLAALEERAPLGGNGLGVLEVLVEERARNRHSGRRRHAWL